MKKAFDLLYRQYREVILLITFALYLVIGVVNSSVLQNERFWFIFAKVCSALCAFIFGSYFIIDLIKRKFKVTPFLIVGAICSFCAVIFAHDATLCFFLTLLYIFKDCDFTKILKCGAVALLFSLVFIIVLSVTGIIDNQIHSRGDVYRMTFGFQSAVTASLWFFCFCAAYNFCRKEKITFVELFVETGVNVLIYYFTNTRGGALLTGLIIIGSLVMKLFNLKPVKESTFVKKIVYCFNKRKVRCILGWFFVFMPLLIFIGYAVLILLYQTQSDLILKINNLLSGRLEFTYNAFLNYQITLFGGIYNWFNSGGYYIGVDTAFYHYLFNIGSAGMVFVLIISILLCYKGFHEKKYWLCFFIFLFVIDSMIDSLFYNVRYNLFLLSLIDGQTFRKMLFGENINDAKHSEKIVITENDRNLLKQIKLSIIVPVYNGEKFIRNCINKLLQIDLNKEIIVVNDCSTDSSLKILQSYYDKIILVDLKENGGVSHARNIGLQKATGDYVTFLDIDDDFELDMHAKLLKEIINGQGDVCMCNNDVIEVDGKILKSKYAVNFGNIEQKEVISLYLRDKIFPAVWASVYRANLAKSVQFEEHIRIGEDIMYVLQILLKAKRTCFVNETLYHYIQYPSSAMHSISNRMIEYLQVPDRLSDDEKTYLNTNFLNEFDYFKLEMIQRAVHAISLVAKHNKKQASEMLKSIVTKDNCKAIIKNKNTPRYAKIEFFVLKNFGISFHLFVFPFYVLMRKVLRR